MESEKVKEIKELLRCMNGEKACTDCYINEIAQEQETNCVSVIADMVSIYINELESENDRLLAEKQKVLEYMKTDNYAKLKKEDMYWGYQMGIGMLEHEIDRQKDKIAKLKKENEILRKHNIGYHIANNYEAQEQLKQFAERLKEKLFDLGNIVNESDIDETLKEFLK